MNSNLFYRFITGLALLVILVTTLWLSDTAFLGLILVFLILGGCEWPKLLGIKSYWQKSGYFAIYILGLCLIFFADTETLITTFSFLAICAWAVLFFHMNWPNKISPNLFAWLLPPVSWCVTWIAWYSVIYLVVVFGRWNLFYFMVLIGLSDIFAYFAGRWFGTRKLAVHVSPSKTIEGAVGGIVGPLFIAWFFSSQKLFFSGWLYGLIIALFLGILGDLFISGLKRRQKLKDSGSLLPGHGGILDRIDSYLVALPAFMMIFNAMPV